MPEFFAVEHRFGCGVGLAIVGYPEDHEIQRITFFRLDYVQHLFGTVDEALTQA